jgi:hypothetical protein
MPQPENLEQVALWLPLVGLIALVGFGLRRPSAAGGRELLALAIASALGCLFLTLVPAIQ